MDSNSLLALTFVGLLVCGLVGALITSSKQGGCAGFLLGFLFGPIGILIAAVMANQSQIRQDTNLRYPCPYCAELILRDAKVCRFCGRDVEPLANATLVSPLQLNRDYMRCPVCQRKNRVGTLRCENCGVHFGGPKRIQTA